MDFDALLLGRIQFGFTIAFHILFPAFTIGLASYLAVLEGLWLFTKRDLFKRLYLFWVKVFAISFGMGVVSGIVMSYQLGTNWSEFMRVTGNVLGPLFALEVLTAFFLEASFLGVMLFGWKKVGPRLHFLATVMVAIGTATSTFWIISANSWMQTPDGFAAAADGRLVATDWLRVIFNPSFPARLTHMVSAAYLTTALVVGGASAYQLLKRRDHAESRTALKMAVGMFALLAPAQLVIGHWSGEVVGHHQPLKRAAIEGYWETRANQPLHLVGVPDREAGRNHFQVSVPGVGNIIQGLPKDEVIRGLDSFPRQDWPVVFLVFWSFRFMVGLGLLMIGLGAWGAVQWARGRLESDRWFLRAAVAMSPAGFLAVLFGWITAEVGRQPYVAYGVLRTADAASPLVAGQVGASLMAFMVIYAIVFTAGALFIFRLLHEGPESAAGSEAPYVQRVPGWTMGAAPQAEAEGPVR
ncbi:MAG: cytochrome ubiquinol oxidase subunit I [Proteobacteria bacterium]|nr:cytochrome ubiquinol oxidase subunit I [Pseudomonadota bacterium]